MRLGVVLNVAITLKYQAGRPPFIIFNPLD
jgi:hypothetical protein